jgi:hypothetical protein
VKEKFLGPLNSCSWQFAYILYDRHLYLYPTDTNTLYKSKPNITNNTHFFLVTISMHTTAALRYTKQTVWTALQLTTNTRQTFVPLNSAMFAPWRTEWRGNWGRLSSGSLDYVMLYSQKLFLCLMNFWATVTQTCRTRKVVRSDKQHNKNCFN